MKAITGNRLSDGVVVYLGEDGSWKERFEEARLLSEEEAESVLQETQKRVREITGAYLVSATEDRRPAGRETLRETIRNAGPTVRLDLGKQAERVQ